MSVTFTTSTLSYHTSLGFVHIITRPSLGLCRVVDGKIVNLLTNFDKADKTKWFCFYLVLFKPAKKAKYVYVTLGCGAIVKFDYDAATYLEDGRSQVDLDQLELVEALPLEVDVEDLYPELEAFKF